jgi:hypothetical protein
MGYSDVNRIEAIRTLLSNTNLKSCHISTLYTLNLWCKHGVNAMCKYSKQSVNITYHSDHFTLIMT